MSEDITHREAQVGTPPAKAVATATSSSPGPASRGLAKIRHELRTPINHIIGFSEMLLEDAAGRVSEGFLQDLQRIRGGGDELLTLITQHFSEASLPTAKPDLHQLCHELRTPVNHIIGYSELLMEQCVDLGRADFEADLGRINSAAKTWLALMEEHLIGRCSQDSWSPRRAERTETKTLARVGPAQASSVPDYNSPAAAAAARLLLADDDEANRELLSRRLEKLGYEVIAVGDGREALEKVGSGQFDLVLLDLLMPGMDGREVLSRMKADVVLRHLPVIMVSALDQVEGIVQCIELGAEDYVAKPFNPVFLRARIGAVLEKKRLRDSEVSCLRQIQDEKQRSEKLLHIILPQDVADELKATNRVQPRRFENAGVLFCDIVGFTSYCDRHPPEEILTQLQSVVEVFEELTSQHGLEKIKTIGDSFMGTVGLRNPVPNPALNCVRCGFDMIAAAQRLPPYWQVRVGVHVGSVIAGVVGHRKYQYDVWGDTVNLAARMEKAAEPGSVCVTADTWRLLDGYGRAQPVGRLDIKGKGPLELIRLH
jgi:class 3 adenylate cyclase/CheY-like chemotaxis protein